MLSGVLHPAGDDGPSTPPIPPATTTPTLLALRPLSAAASTTSSAQPGSHDTPLPSANGTLWVGRWKERVGLWLDDRDRQCKASRLHAQIVHHPTAGHCTLVDHDSANGTFVNGERIVGARALSVGDVVGFGSSGMGNYAAQNGGERANESMPRFHYVVVERNDEAAAAAVVALPSPPRGPVIGEAIVRARPVVRSVAPIQLPEDSSRDESLRDADKDTDTCEETSEESAEASRTSEGGGSEEELGDLVVQGGSSGSPSIHPPDSQDSVAAVAEVEATDSKARER